MSGPTPSCRRPASSCRRAAALFLLLLLPARPAGAAGAAGTARDSDAVEVAIIKGRSWRFAIQATAVANLTYQLDCLTGQVHCSEGAYRDLWRRELGWTPEDDRRIDELRALSARYAEVSLAPAGTVPAATPYPLPERGVSLWDKLRIAGLQARDLDDYLGRAGLLLSPTDAARLVAIARHFQPRFDRYWRRHQAPLQRYASEMAALIRRLGLVELAEQAAVFYAADLPADHTIWFSLIARPRHEDHQTSAEQMDNYSVAEVTEGERPAERVDVLMHEVFHYLYSAAPEEKQAALVRDFAAAPSPRSLAAYNLLNEALATTLGNGVVARRAAPERFDVYLRRQRSFYSDDAIDRAAKAILGLIEGRVLGGRPLYDGFVPEYLARVEGDLKELLDRPALALREAVMVHDPPLREARRRLCRLVRAGSVHSRSPIDDPDARAYLARYPELSGALLLRKADLPRLGPWQALLGASALPALQKLAAERPGFIYGVRRTGHARLYVFVAEDEAGLAPLFQRFAAAPSGWTGPDPSP